MIFVWVDGMWYMAYPKDRNFPDSSHIDRSAMSCSSEETGLDEVEQLIESNIWDVLPITTQINSIMTGFILHAIYFVW